MAEEYFQRVSPSSSGISYAFLARDSEGKAARLTTLPAITHFKYPHEYRQNWFDPETGQGEFFRVYHKPRRIGGLYSTPDAGHLVSTLLAHAHRVHNGDITHPDSLTPYSLRIAQRAVDKGWIKPLTIDNDLQVPGGGDTDKQQTRTFWEPKDIGLTDPRQVIEPRTKDEYNTRSSVDNMANDAREYPRIPDSEIQQSKIHLRGLIRGSIKQKSPKVDAVDQPALPGMETS